MKNRVEIQNRTPYNFYGSGIPKCMNIHCKESPNYKE